MTRYDEFYDDEDALFHYTKLSTAIEHILPDKQLKFPLLIDSKDPAESKYKWIGISGVGIAPTNNNDLYSAMQKINTALDNCRVVSFCSNKKSTLVLQNNTIVEDINNRWKGWEKARMWEQYAENHCGVCLVFSKKELENTLHSLSQIKYKTDYVKYYQQISPWDRSLKSPSDADIKKYVDEILQQKHIDYRDEAEYRITIFSRETEYEYIDITSSIKGVILGNKTSNVYDSLIQKLYKDHQSGFLKILCEPTTGKLNLCPKSKMLNLKDG